MICRTRVLRKRCWTRLSFRRFCGFALDAPTPDETTIWRFREQAGALLEAAFEEINRQLDAKGLVVRQGTLMDATLVASASRPPPYKAGAGARHPREPDADWTMRNGKAFFGYKAHVGVDRGSSLVRRAGMTSAKIYESTVADGLISGDEAAAYGDKGLRAQGPPRPAQGGRDQGPHHAPAAQAHTPGCPIGSSAATT